jgi:aminopeptidase N
MNQEGVPQSVTTWCGQRDAIVLHWKQAMGDDKFDTFLRTYYRQNLYSVAAPEQLLNAAYTVLDKPTVPRLYDEWIKGVRRP